MPQQIEVPGMGIVEFPDSMTDAQISSAIRHNMQQSQPKPSRGVLGTIDDAVRSIASGVTFGYADELAAKMDELTGRGGSYAQNVEKERARDAQISPFVSVPGQIAGAIGSGVAAAPFAAASGLSRAAQAIPQTLRYAGLGGAAGAVSGSGEATEGNRLSGALQGAAIGAPVGAAAPAVVRGASNLAAGVRNAFSPQANVTADLGRAIARDADTPANMLARATTMAVDRPGAVTLADVGGENVKGLVERVAQTPGAGRTQVIPALTMRQQQQAARIGDDLRTLTGTNRTATQAVEQTIAERRDAARPLYDEAFNFNARANPEIVRAFQEATATGYGRSILNSANLRRSIQTEYGIRDINDAPLMVLIDAWKKQVDDVTGSAVRGGQGNTARVLTGMRDNVLRVVDQHNPRYAEARNAWAGPSQYLDAIERGRGILGSRVSGEEFATRFRALPAVEQEAERIGAVSAIVAKMGSDMARLGDMTKYLRSPEVRAKIAAIMPTPEAAQTWARRLEFEIESSALTGRALGNSATARRLAEQNDAAGLVGDLVMDALSGGSHGMLRRIIMAGPRWLRDTLRSRADAQLADVLTNPQRMHDLPNVLQRAVPRGQPSQLGRAATTLGGTELFSQ